MLKRLLIIVGILSILLVSCSKESEVTSTSSSDTSVVATTDAVAAPVAADTTVTPDTK